MSDHHSNRPEKPIRQAPVGRTDPAKPPPSEGFAHGLSEKAHEIYMAFLRRYPKKPRKA